jgi:hypothetical protein
MTVGAPPPPPRIPYYRTLVGNGVGASDKPMQTHETAVR